MAPFFTAATCPSKKAAFTRLEWQLLWRSHHRDQSLPTQGPSLKDAMRWMANLGGFSPNKGDPGVKRLTRGLQCLHHMVIGAQLITSTRQDVSSA